MNLTTNSEDIVMKLLHYFITDKNYNPVILYGAKNEIWLENLNSDYKIIRIVSNYIHNDEQLNYDLFKTKQIMKSIKKKTLSLKTPTLSLFVNLGDNVNLDEKQVDFITCVNVKQLDDIVSNNTVLSIFPDINKTLNYEEEGMELFIKLTEEINKKTEEDAKKSEDIFKLKKPIMTYAILIINVIVFLLMYLMGNGSEDLVTILAFGANNRTLVIEYNQFYRMITSCFIHFGLLHLFFNSYALYVIGSQVESFFGKFKFLLIYLGSGIIGNLLSICFSNSISGGASGCIFGLLGALLYFGNHYRLYLGNAMKSQIIPTILINLMIGFMIPGVDNFAHIGGLIGGLFISKACGIKYKSTKIERINGIILTTIFVSFLIILLSSL